MLTMPHAQRSQPEQLIGCMGSLCDPTRLRLLHLIERQELGVAELCDVLQLPQSTVSRHLKLLAEQNWTVCRRNGTANFYSMAVEELDSQARRLWLLAREQIADSSSARQDQLRLVRRLRNRRTQAQRFFAGAAGHWDKLRQELYGKGFTAAAILGLLPAEWKVADLGCGTGIIASELAPYVRQVIGVDQSPDMLQAARKYTSHLKNIDLRLGDLEALPMNRAEVDGVVLSIVLTYVPDPVAVLREAARVTRAGGKLVIVDLLNHEREDFRRQMDQHWPGFEPKQLMGMLVDAGWKPGRWQVLPPEPDVKGPALLQAGADRESETQEPKLGRPK